MNLKNNLYLNKMTEKVSVVTILHGETEFIPLIKDNYQNFCNKI